MANTVLVAYYTKGGASETYANVIAKTLTEFGFAVEERNLAEEIPDVESFDSVVLGTGVRMFHVYNRWKKVLKQKALKDKRLFLFLASGMAIDKPDEAVAKFLQPLVEKYGLNPVSLVSFPGKIPEKWAKLDAEKDSMKPDAAKAWAQQIADQIQGIQK